MQPAASINAPADAAAEVVAEAEAIAAAVICDEANCREAYSAAETCRCACGGEGHGIRWRAEAARGRAKMAARIQRAGSTFALLSAADDEAW